VGDAFPHRSCSADEVTRPESPGKPESGRPAGMSAGNVAVPCSTLSPQSLLEITVAGAGRLPPNPPESLPRNPSRSVDGGRTTPSLHNCRKRWTSPIPPRPAGGAGLLAGLAGLHRSQRWLATRGAARLRFAVPGSTAKPLRNTMCSHRIEDSEAARTKRVNVVGQFGRDIGA
jgi:hypothetical protein